MPKRARFIGFAFANADFLLEVAPDGRIAFAMGAESDFVPPGFGALDGRPASALFASADGAKFLTRMQALAGGGRGGPFKLKLVTGAVASVSMFRLPHAENVSCTLTKVGPRVARSAPDPATGLATRDAFLDAVGKASHDGDRLMLIDLPGVGSVPGAKIAGLLRRIGDFFRAFGSKAAGRVSESSFGLIAGDAAPQVDLKYLQALLAESGVGAAPMHRKFISLRSGTLSPAQRILALRHAVERFAAGDRAGDADLQGEFRAIMSETEQRLSALGRTVADGDFALAFQPIHALGDGALSHYEALSRFDPTETGNTIKFVEDLGIADTFDLVVAWKTLAALKAERARSVSVAFNVSGATIASPPSFGLLSGFLAREPELASRLLVEITETAEIEDFEAAAKAVQALRDMGIRVGLDDFGAGAASLHYLHALPVDFVKFDGTLVRKMGSSERDDTLLRGMIGLCHQLGVKTVAEYIETREQAETARALGFDYGQGFHFGMAGPRMTAAKPASNAKRMGVREDWR